MVKLTKYFNYKGLLYEPGAIVSLPPEIEAKLIKNKSAEIIKPVEVAQPAAIKETKSNKGVK